MSDKWRCYRCGMKFFETKPDGTGPVTDATICAEPRCNVRFGHAEKMWPNGKVRVWLEPRS